MKLKGKFFEKLSLLMVHLQDPVKVAKKKGVRVGNNCHFNTTLFGSEPYLISIGDKVRLASGVSFITHDGGVGVLRNIYEELKDVDLINTIKIGNNVTIGVKTCVLLGSEIGDNVIVGCLSVVKGKLEPNSVYAGVPAKFICTLDEYKLKNSSKFLKTRQMNYQNKKDFLMDYYRIIEK